MSAPGASDEESPRKAGVPAWIVPVLAIVVMGGIAALAFLDTRAQPPQATRVELPIAEGVAAAADAKPDPALVEQSPDGPIPIIAQDGRQAWQVYARPFDAADKRPRVALLVAGLGLDIAATKEAIANLPPQVSLGFSPYAHDLLKWMGAARAAGHETLLGLPLEPTDFPRRDPGPETLLTGLAPAQNLDRLKVVLGRGAAYVGLVGIMGDRFTADRASLEPLLEALKARGLLYVDDNDPKASATAPLASALGMAWAVTDRRIDQEPAAASVDQALGALEETAKQGGAALGLGTLYPVTLDRVAAWAKTLDGKGLALAPATAVAGRQSVEKQAAQ